MSLKIKLCFFLIASVLFLPIGDVKAEKSTKYQLAYLTSSRSAQITVASTMLTVASLRDFDACFRFISDQTHTTILVEGVPLHAKLTDEQVALLRPNVPLDHSAALTLPMIESIAASYEYDVDQTDARTFLLRKKYEDPEDLPCVTFPEVVHALKEIDKLANYYAPQDTSNPTALEVRFVDSFTLEQLKSTHDGIPIGSLAPEQRDMALAVAGAMWLGEKTQFLHQLLKELTRLDDPTTRFEWIEEHSINAFGYEGPFGPNRARWPILFTNGTGYKIGGGVRFMPLPADGIDPALPTDRDRALATGMLANRLPSTKTLGEFAQATPPSEKVKLTVNAAVTDKPFSLFGAQYATQKHLIRSLSALYGLELLVPKEDDFTITLPQSHTIERGSDIPAEIQRVVPLPLAHFLAAHPLADSPVFNLAASSTNQPNLTPRQRTTLQREQFQREQARLQKATMAHDAALESCYYPAVRRLLALTLPAVPTLQSRPVAIKALNPEVYRLIAIIRLMGEPLKQIDGLEKLEVPSIMNDTASMFVLVYKRGNFFSISFGPSAMDAYGVFHGQLSVGRTNAPKLDSPFLRD